MDSQSLKRIDPTLWERASVYQIYPFSFQDSNGDGVGDLKGIMNRVDYIKSLGVTTIWISPIFRSPMKDLGYDVSNFRDIDPLFGTLSDYQNLIDTCHQQSIRVLMDFVPNHTSDQHAWFIESKKSKNNPKNDWYIWRDPKSDGSPPNNWITVGGGGFDSAWTYVEERNQYYLHSFTEFQPDLNWRNEEVVEEMLDTLRFWMDDIGVDGFRMDVLYYLLKHNEFLDEPLNHNWRTIDPYEHPNERLIHIYSKDLPETKELITKMADLISQRGKLMVSEVYVPQEKRVELYSLNSQRLHIPFNFDLVFSKWDAKTVRKIMEDYLSLLNPKDLPTWIMGNHDQTRQINRLGSKKQARNAHVLVQLSRGIPFTYYGDEIGMTNGFVPQKEYVDLFTPNRDSYRTPMQWNSKKNAGFTTGKPWIRIAQNYKTVNVENEEKDPFSMLMLFRKINTLRQLPVIYSGEQQFIDTHNEDVLGFIRFRENQKILVLLNMSTVPQEITLDIGKKGTLIFNTSLDQEEGTVINLSRLTLFSEEGYIIRL